MRLLFAVLILMMLAGCASTATRNAELYTQARAADERAAQAAALREAFAQSADGLVQHFPISIIWHGVRGLSDAVGGFYRILCKLWVWVS